MAVIELKPTHEIVKIYNKSVATVDSSCSLWGTIIDNNDKYRGQRMYRL